MTCFASYNIHNKIKRAQFFFVSASIDTYMMIELLNLKPGDLFDHAVILLSGQCSNFETPSIEIVDSFGSSIILPIRDGYFKVVQTCIIYFVNKCSQYSNSYFKLRALFG
jgi:hypothetical protein